MTTERPLIEGVDYHRVVSHTHSVAAHAHSVPPGFVQAVGVMEAEAAEETARLRYREGRVIRFVLALWCVGAGTALILEAITR